VIHCLRPLVFRRPVVGVWVWFSFQYSVSSASDLSRILGPDKISGAKVFDGSIT
jgi:hypothetical protein